MTSARRPDQPAGGAEERRPCDGGFPSDAEGNPPSDPGDEAAARVDSDLDALLADVKRERDEYLELAQRARADFENYRKRAAREAQEAERRGKAAIARELLPALDNLERALNAAGQDVAPSSAKIAEGVRMVLRQLKEALGKVGVREVQTQGLAFDPTRHEAVDIVGVPASDDGRIVEEVQHGYLLHERLLRPAKVVVGRAERDATAGGA